MNKKIDLNFETLLNKFFEDKCNLAEKQHLYDLVYNSDNEKTFKKILLDQLNEMDDNQVVVDDSIEFDRIYRNISLEIEQSDILETEIARINARTKIKNIFIYSSSLAAIFIIAFLLGNFFSFFENRITPVSESEYTYTEINAPFGSKSEIKLPDGTIVMLNAGSRLKYRNDFNLINRDLDLTGEGYFTVAKNNSLPLIVSAGSIIIKALGTEFNVKAYDEEGIIETTLIEGKIDISQSGKSENENQLLELEPNQKAVYIKESDSFTLEEIKANNASVVKTIETVNKNIIISPDFDVTEVVAWTQGKLIIRGESLENLCVDLKRKYDVNFIFRDEAVKEYRFSGVLLDETLEQVLNVIQLTAPIDYNLNGKTVFMSTDKEKLDNYLNYLK